MVKQQGRLRSHFVEVYVGGELAVGHLCFEGRNHRVKGMILV